MSSTRSLYNIGELEFYDKDSQKFVQFSREQLLAKRITCAELFSLEEYLCRRKGAYFRQAFSNFRYMIFHTPELVNAIPSDITKQVVFDNGNIRSMPVGVDCDRFCLIIKVCYGE
jgi:hypothetical protein